MKGNIMLRTSINTKIRSDIVQSTNHASRKANLLSALIVGASMITSCATLASATDKQSATYKTIRALGYGHLSARALHVACYYKLFDQLQNGESSPKKVATALNLDPSAVKRIMRVLANHDLLEINDNETYSLTEKSALLVSTAKGSFQPALAKEFDARRWASFGRLDIAMKDAKVPFDTLYGESFYEYLERDQMACELFNSGMKNYSVREDRQIADNFDFSGFDTYCDIGGGTGGLITNVIAKSGNIKGILFEIPSAIEQTELKDQRISKVGGDFFKAVPRADVYTVKRVMHNWNDENCIKILTNIRDSITDLKNGRILVIDKVMPQKSTKNFLVDSDILSMALGGIERTLAEFKEIGDAANLELEQQIDLESGVSILVFKAKA